MKTHQNRRNGPGVLTRKGTPKFVKVPIALLYHPLLSADKKHLLYSLLDFARQKTTAFPSQRHLADLLGFSRSKVNRLLTELVSAGFLDKTDRYRSDGMRSTNVYDLALLHARLAKLAKDTEPPTPYPGELEYQAPDFISVDGGNTPPEPWELETGPDLVN